MEMEPGKLFVGGISWDTNEDRLRDYFQKFGEVVEAVIMKDRTTGRARGFGFVVFADPSVAERVVREKHIIDGRTVEAKKAVPRDDQLVANRNNGSVQGSPGPARTKKIFVGGLASSVTESDFKKYFDQFGIITDVVVMYDHNTQRPRGFGFITYDSEEAVDKVLLKTFHELNGKMVEVKRAVPKELSPGATRGQLGGYNHNLNRVNSFLNVNSPGYSPGSVGGYGARSNGRYSPVTVGRSGYPSFVSSSYFTGPTLDSGLNSIYGGSGNVASNVSYGRGLGPFEDGNSHRYNSPIGYGLGRGGANSMMNSTNWNMWGNGSLNYGTDSVNSRNFIGSGSGNTEFLGGLGTTGAIWGSSPVSSQAGGSGTFGSGKVSYSAVENGFASGGGYGRTNGDIVGTTSSYAATSDPHDGAFDNLYGSSSSFYGDPAWKSSSPELEGSDPFTYGIRTAASDVISNNSSVGFAGGYSVTSRSNRGIAA